MQRIRIRRGALSLIALLGMLLLAACGSDTATSAPAATTAAATTGAATTAAATTAAMTATTAAATTAAATTASATTAAATTAATTAAATTPGTTGATTGGTGEVVVYAAASLTDSFNQIKAAFESANPGTKVTLNFAGSSVLRTQLDQGAKADVFASADQKNMDAALKSGDVADAGQTFVKNRLVLIIPKTNKANITTLQDIGKAGIKFVTAQQSVPIGQYTLDALDKMSKDAAFSSDFKTKVMQNFVSQETDVKQIVAKVQTGEADAGIVYTTDVTAKVQPDVTIIAIPDQYNVIATYPIALTKTPVNPVLAKQFIAFVQSSAGQQILQKSGFIPAAGNAGGAASPSSSFQLAGLVTTPATLALADVKAFTETSVTTNPQSSKGPLGQHSYSGALLYDVIQKAGLQTDASRKNDALRKAIIVTGSDGYSVAIAWGEIDPKFGGKKIILADAQDGQPLPQADGFVRLIVPGDTYAGRYVSNVVKITVQDASPVTTPGSANLFAITGDVNTAGAVSADTFKGLKQTQVTVSGKDAAGNATQTAYNGVLLTDLLQSVGQKLDASSKNPNLRVGIYAVGSDGYAALVVGGEIDPKFGNIQVLVATGKDGQPLPSTDGAARLVVPGDAAQGRYVSNIVALQVVTFTA